MVLAVSCRYRYWFFVSWKTGLIPPRRKSQLLACLQENWRTVRSNLNFEPEDTHYIQTRPSWIKTISRRKISELPHVQEMTCINQFFKLNARRMPNIGTLMAKALWVPRETRWKKRKEAEEGIPSCPSVLLKNKTQFQDRQTAMLWIGHYKERWQVASAFSSSGYMGSKPIDAHPVIGMTAHIGLH